MKKLSLLVMTIIALLSCASFTQASEIGININLDSRNESVSISSNFRDCEQHQEQHQTLTLKPEPKGMSAIRIKIADAKEELKKCNLASYSNLLLREELVIQYKAAYDLTGNVQHLEQAILNAYLAERNYKTGFDIKQHQTKAKQTIRQVYRYWAYSILHTANEAAAKEFAKKKGIEVF